MKKYNGINTGKICSIEVIETRDIQSMVLDTDQLTAYIEPIFGKDFMPILFTDKTATVEVKEQNPDDGSKPHYCISLSARVPKLHADRISCLYGIKNSTFVCRFTDTENNAFLVGTNRSPAQLHLDYCIAPAPSGGNDISIRILSFTAFGLFMQIY